MKRLLLPWQGDQELEQYLRDLELHNEVMWSLMTEEQRNTVDIIMKDLQDDKLMKDDTIFDGLPEQ